MMNRARATIGGPILESNQNLPKCKSRHRQCDSSTRPSGRDARRERNILTSSKPGDCSCTPEACMLAISVNRGHFAGYVHHVRVEFTATLTARPRWCKCQAFKIAALCIGMESNQG